MRGRDAAFIAGSGLLAGLLAACSSGTPAADASPTADDRVDWSYSGSTGPANWASINPEFAVCASGNRQSPIDVRAAQPANNRQLPRVNYPGTFGNVVNNGHTVQVSPGPDHILTLGGARYELLQMHFHAPGENQLDGRSFPLEFHFVHEGPNGQYAVVAVFANAGAANPAWQPYIDAADATLGEIKTDVVEVKWSDLMPRLTSVIEFDGSLTTPPCTEGIRWVVNPTPITLSQDQIDALTAVYDNNSRPVQPTNDRPIEAVTRR